MISTVVTAMVIVVFGVIMASFVFYRRRVATYGDGLLIYQWD